MPFRMGPMEIGLIVVIVLIVFGAGKLPQIGGALGRSIREFQKAQRDDYEGEDEASKPESAATNNQLTGEDAGIGVTAKPRESSDED